MARWSRRPRSRRARALTVVRTGGSALILMAGRLSARLQGLATPQPPDDGPSSGGGGLEEIGCERARITAIEHGLPRGFAHRAPPCHRRQPTGKDLEQRGLQVVPPIDPARATVRLCRVRRQGLAEGVTI